VRCVVFHPSGKFILSSSDDKTIRVMDIKVRTSCWYSCSALHVHPLIHFSLFFFSFYAYKFETKSNSHKNCSVDNGRTLRTQEGRCLRTIGDAHAHFITTLAMSSVSPILISGSVDKNIGIWACS
jgi:WD40 repeat protein